MKKSGDSGEKHVRHAREDVAAAALAILDEYGLPDLTMRRLASTLDVQPSALYWHFDNKQTLLAHLADEIIARAAVLQPSSDDWAAAVRCEAETLRDALLAFRDGAEVVSSTLALGLGAGEAQERLARAIAAAGFEPETCEIAAAAFLHFILGHVSHEQQRLQADSLGVVSPALSADPSGAKAGSLVRESFDFGITLLVTGLELQRAGIHH
jgi:TetR/AcrR family tetracycline transcriptional repressor